MKQAIIVGAGTYGQVYLEYLRENYNVIGFIDDDESLKDKLINGITVLGNFEYLVDNINKNTNIFVPIGNNKVRVKFLSKLIKSGFSTPNYIHPKTTIHKTVKIGKGVYILPGSNIMPFAVLEDYVLVSMGVNIAHHTIISRGCFLSQGNNVGASIKFEECVFSGIGATVMTGVKTIGENSVIGAGAVVIKNVPICAVVVGVPGRIIKVNS